MALPLEFSVIKIDVNRHELSIKEIDRSQDPTATLKAADSARASIQNGSGAIKKCRVGAQ